MKKAIASICIAGLAVLGLTACNPELESGPVDPATPGQEIGQPQPEGVDPLTTDGEYLVPSEVAPGTYRAVPRPGTWYNYIEVCADVACDIDLDGSDYTGLIDNYAVSGATYVEVPDYAVLVKLNGVNLS